ncbi:MAG: DUF6090 family protein [Parvularculaceae bacterium]
MILRRVIEHFRKQEWTAIFLDFVIVVVGVFIGIQVSNWNERNAEVRQGRDYQDRIVADLRADHATTQTQLDYYRTVLENIVEAERLLGLAEPEPRALLVAAYRASELAKIPKNRATWEQIVSSGHVGLLSKSVLDSGLADYYKYNGAKNNSYDLLEVSPYRRTVRSIIPVRVQLLIREGCSDLTDEVQVITGFAAECRLDVDAATLEEIAAQLRASPALKADLRYQLSLVVSVVNNEQGNIVLLDRLLGALGAEGGGQ